jgi:hypothetical protein
MDADAKATLIKLIKGIGGPKIMANRAHPNAKPKLKPSSEI